ncbi:hypothetical protein ACFL2H_04450 [Planctomycetota bacterium]
MVDKTQIEEGRGFIKQLQDSGFDVNAALWVLPSDDAIWLLYIASDRVNDGLAQAYREVYGCLSNSQFNCVSRSVIKLISSDHPLALDAIAHRQEVLPFIYRGRMLGETIIETAYIYPRRPLTAATH